METIKAQATGRSLVDHWDWAAKKGLMNLNTARSLRAACAQVLGVLEDWQTIDIQTLDVDDTLDRFVTLRMKDFKPESLETYKQRFRQAVGLYLAYVRDPGGWRPQRRPERASKPGKRGTLIGSELQTSRASNDEPVSAGMISYPFPLREGQIVRLVLPADLRRAEVRRLTAYMELIAVDHDA